MPSKSQQLRGYPIPETIDPQAGRCIVFQIPDSDEYQMIAIAQMSELGKWWKWKKTTPQDRYAAITAEVWREWFAYAELGETVPCELLDPDGGIIVGTIEDICEGVLCALSKAGTALAAGINSGISVSVDDDGNIIVDTDGGGGATTAIAQERLNGSANQAYAGLIEYIQDFEDFFGLFPASQANTVTFLTSKWFVDETLVTQAVADYYDHRELMNPQPPPPDDDLIEEFFCEGITKSTTAAYIIDVLTVDQLLLLSMTNALLQDQYSIWQSDGADNPDGDYLGFDCYRRPTFTFDIAASTVAEEFPSKKFITLGLYNGISSQRNIKVTVSGKFTAPTGEEYDILYWKDDEGVVNQQGWQVFGLALNNGDFEVPMFPPTQLPYSATGDYSWIATVNSGNYTTFAWRAPNFPDNWQETVTGTITVTIEDQGKAI